MAPKKPLIQRMADILLEIDEQFDLKTAHPNVHKRLTAVLEELAEDEGRDKLDDEWYYDNGY
jgi:hypothetical protein